MNWQKRYEKEKVVKPMVDFGHDGGDTTISGTFEMTPEGWRRLMEVFYEHNLPPRAILQ